MMELAMKKVLPPEPIPANMQRRPALYDLQGREPSAVFELLRSRPTTSPHGCSTKCFWRYRTRIEAGQAIASRAIFTPDSGRRTCSPSFREQKAPGHATLSIAGFSRREPPWRRGLD